MKKYETIHKRLGETPLEALERFRNDMMVEHPHKSDFWRKTPLTYAGRLDPLAEGELIILIDEECKNKDAYLGLDKEYELEILFGIETDSYDALGMPTLAKNIGKESAEVWSNQISNLDFSKYVGKFSQPYPPFSSKTFKGKQLHQLARADDLPDEMPRKDVEIYSIEKIDRTEDGDGIGEIDSKRLLEVVTNSINLVKGDFRQENISSAWKNLLSDSSIEFPVVKIRVKCSSGTYMRSLARKIGKDLGSPAFTLSIKRSKIFTQNK